MLWTTIAVEYRVYAEIPPWRFPVTTVSDFEILRMHGMLYISFICVSFNFIAAYLYTLKICLLFLVQTFVVSDHLNFSIIWPL